LWEKIIIETVSDGGSEAILYFNCEEGEIRGEDRFWDDSGSHTVIQDFFYAEPLSNLGRSKLMVGSHTALIKVFSKIVSRTAARKTLL
jgi:hypothetical protein